MRLLVFLRELINLFPIVKQVKVIQRDIVKVGFISKVSYVSKEVYEKVTVLDTIEMHEFDRVSISSDILRKN